MIHPGYAEAHFVATQVGRILDLRETLVRFDENLAAWNLLSRCVPFFAVDHPAIVQARDEQYLMVRHVLPRDELRPEDRDRDPYADYYASNVHEAVFEVQYGIGVEEAHRIPRVQFLLDGLGAQHHRITRDPATPPENWATPTVLDLSANDGWMAAKLSGHGYRCDCLDLHPGNVAIAHERRERYPLIGRVEQGALEDAPRTFGLGGWVSDDPGRPEGYWSIRSPNGGYDCVVGFETIEHVRSPRAMLDAMVACCKPDGRLYVSTPNGACEGGNLPNYAHVEPKGHVRVYTEASFRAQLEAVGSVEELVLGPDGVLVARVAPR